jgi:T5orf172 domain
MAQGFVYILLNPSFPDQIKIGLTTGTSERRAKQLWSTGVPTPFIVVYDELVSDCELVESRLHERFSGYRVSSGREFFRVPVREAVRALQEEAAIHSIQEAKLHNRIEILPALKQKYDKYLKPDIVGVEIIQLPDVCFLESIRRSYQHLRDEIIERIDLAVMGDTFPPTDPIDVNTRRFLEGLDEYDLIMVTSLFTEDACERIAYEWEVGGKLKQSQDASSGQ